jgi:hypothetical protein
VADKKKGFQGRDTNDFSKIYFFKSLETLKKFEKKNIFAIIKINSSVHPLKRSFGIVKHKKMKITRKIE